MNKNEDLIKLGESIRLERIKQKLSQEENTIINLYRCLSPSMRKHLEAILTQLAKTEQES